MTYIDRSHSARRPCGEMTYEPLAPAFGEQVAGGHVDTPDGIVSVSGGLWNGKEWLALAVCHAGRRHVRRFDRLYAPRRIVTLAAKFAAEVVGDTGVEILRVVALAGALGYDLTLSASAGDDPPHVGIVTEDEALYYGNLAAARRWLEEAVGERAEDEP